VSTAAADRSWRHDPRWRRRLTDYERNRYQQQRAGTWAPFTFTGPVRAHLHHLHACGMTQREISLVAGVSVTAMHRAMKASRMSTAAAQALFAVQPTQDRPGELARQALRTLVADGWTLQQLADATRLSVRTIGRTVNDRNTPLPATAAAIRDVHQHLSLEDPGDGAAATHARLRAVRASWEPNTPGLTSTTSTASPSTEPSTATSSRCASPSSRPRCTASPASTPTMRSAAGSPSAAAPSCGTAPASSCPRTAPVNQRTHPAVSTTETDLRRRLVLVSK